MLTFGGRRDVAGVTGVADVADVTMVGLRGPICYTLLRPILADGTAGSTAG
jgi:hypothetical protein